MEHPFYRASKDDADASIELPKMDGLARSIVVRISREHTRYSMHLDYEIEGDLYPIGSLPITARLFNALFPPKK